MFVKEVNYKSINGDFELEVVQHFICAADLTYRPAFMVVVEIRRMAPLYEIKLLRNLV